MVKKDTAQKRLVHFSGFLSSEVVVSDRKLPFQSVPASYMRVIFMPAIDIGIIPLKGNVMLSTEQFGVAHSLNNYNLSFDYLTFADRLRKQVTLKKHLEDSLTASDSLLQAYKQYSARYRTLKLQLSNPRYLQDIERNRRILAGDSLKLPGKNLQLKQARLKIEQHTALQNELKDIEAKLPLLENYRRNKRVEDFGKNLETPSLNRDLKKYGLHKPGYSHLLAIKRFEIGNASPDYSELTIRGTSLTGVNLEYNPGNLYAAFTYGKTVTSFSNPFSLVSSFQGSRQILGARIGYGKKEGSLICATLLKGWDGRNAEVYDSNYVYYEPSSNTVLSLQGTWKWKEYLKLEGEYAGSLQSLKNQNGENGGVNSKPNGLSETIKKTFTQKGHQAVYVGASSIIKETGTELMLGYRKVQTYYFTFGNPFLRPDNERVSGKVSQSVFKKQVKASVSFRRDADNLMGQKQQGTITRLMNYTLDFHFRNKPFLILNYTPSLQFYAGTSSDKYISRTRVLTAVEGYTYKIRRLTYTTTLTQSRQQMDSRLFTWDYQVNLFALSQQVLFKNGVLVYGNGTLTKAVGRADSVSSLMADVGLSWGIKPKGRLKAGLRYQHDRYLQERYVITSGCTFPLGSSGRFDLSAEHHWVNDERSLYKDYTQVLVRATILKKF